MSDYTDLFAALNRSKFRRRFSLSEQERQYIQEKGMETVLSHARDFINLRLAPAKPENDGRQTPMKGHPAFIAQHATATCCRSCLSKWYGIARGRKLDEKQVTIIIEVIAEWLNRQMESAKGEITPDAQLFDRVA